MIKIYAKASTFAKNYFGTAQYFNILNFDKDASNIVIGVIFLHGSVGGEKPVDFTTRTLKESGQHYDITEGNF